MNHHGVVHFELVADDGDKLSDFYKQLFGWQIEKTDMGGVPYYSVITGPAGEGGMPSEPGFINGGIGPRMSPDQLSMNYVNVEDISAYVSKAKDLGATLLQDRMAVPGMGWFAQLRDPQGNAFGVWQVDPAASM